MVIPVPNRSVFVFLITLIFFSPLQAAHPDSAEALTPSFARFQLKQTVMEQALESYTASAEETVSFRKQKSRARAFLQSLILPGWGQHYAESKTMMKVFIASEVVLWGSFLWFNARSNWLEDDFRTFAATHAEVQPEGKSAEYFVDIGNYDSIFEYNQAQLRNRDVAALYPETEAFFWQWDSAENREDFENLRESRDSAQNRSEFTLAVIFLNHLVSAIQSSFAVFKYNKRTNEQGLRFRFDHDSRLSGSSLSLRIVKHF